MRTYLFLLILLSGIVAHEVYAADAKPLNSCTFDKGQSAFTVSRRVVKVGTKLIRLRHAAKHIECADIDGDGFDEIVSRSGSKIISARMVTAAPALGAVCKRVRSLTRGEIYKSRASDHINDQRKLSTSFITLRSTTPPKNNCLYVYDKSGNLIHKLGRYFPTGTAYSSRYYGGHGCGDLKSASTVANLARSKTGSSAGYMTSGTGNCVLIPNLAACFNSSGC